MSAIGDVSNATLIQDTNYDDRDFKRGEIYYVDLDELGYVSTHVQGKMRPALIIQNDGGNLHGGTIIVALLTTVRKKDYPFQYRFMLNGRESVIMFEQIMTIDKYRLKEKTGELTYQQTNEAEQALMYSLQLNRLSLENIIDFEVLSVINKKTKSTEFTYFEIVVHFEKSVDKIVTISLEKLVQFNKKITKDIEFDELKKLLDNCKGLHWLAKNNEI